MSCFEQVSFDGMSRRMFRKQRERAAVFAAAQACVLVSLFHYNRLTHGEGQREGGARTEQGFLDMLRSAY